MSRRPLQAVGLGLLVAGLAVPASAQMAEAAPQARATTVVVANKCRPPAKPEAARAGVSAVPVRTVDQREVRPVVAEARKRSGSAGALVRREARCSG